MTYMLMPTNSDLLHFGVSAKDGAPGRGSGRYPLGSGKGGQKVSKKQVKKDAKDHINNLRKQEQDEYTESERSWDGVMDGILRSQFDKKTEDYWLQTAIDASLDEHLDISMKYDNLIKDYLIETGLANKKMSDVKIQKLASKIAGSK